MSHVRRTFGLGAKIHEENPPEWRWPNRSHSKCVELNAKRWGNFWGCPEDSYPISTLALEHQVNGLSPGPLPADLLTPPLWQCGVVTGMAVGGFCRRVFNPAHQGIDFLIEILSKSHLGQPPPHTFQHNQPAHVLPMSPGCQPVTPI